MAGIYYRRPEKRSMKKHWLLCTVFAAGLTLGNLLPAHWLAAPVDAAPADVKGSPNVAVDTYKNAKDTYVLWSDGSISLASGGPTINGPTDYKNPPASESIGKTNVTPKRVVGSPNVAIKAICRADMTLVLFADGSFKQPNSGDAGAGSAVPLQLYTGSERMWNPMGAILDPNRVYATRPDYTLETTGGRWKLTLKNPVPKAKSVMADYNVLANRVYYTTCPLRGETTDGGKTWIFDIAAQYQGYDTNDCWPNYFNWTIVGD